MEKKMPDELITIVSEIAKYIEITEKNLNKKIKGDKNENIY